MSLKLKREIPKFKNISNVKPYFVRRSIVAIWRKESETELVRNFSAAAKGSCQHEQGITGGALIPLAFNAILTLLPPDKQSIGIECQITYAIT